MGDAFGALSLSTTTFGSNFIRESNRCRLLGYAVPYAFPRHSSGRRGASFPFVNSRPARLSPASSRVGRARPLAISGCDSTRIVAPPPLPSLFAFAVASFLSSTRRLRSVQLFTGVGKIFISCPLVPTICSRYDIFCNENSFRYDESNIIIIPRRDSADATFEINLVPTRYSLLSGSLLSSILIWNWSRPARFYAFCIRTIYVGFKN